MQHLIVRSRDFIEVVLDMSWEDGVVTIHSATEGMRTAADRWVGHGLHEWVDDPADPGWSRPRTTLVTSPDFLLRLHAYLQFQSGFQMDLQLQAPKFGADDFIRTVI